MMTLASTVKNFLVVVMMEQGRGPNSLTHMKMKNWNGKMRKDRYQVNIPVREHS